MTFSNFLRSEFNEAHFHPFNFITNNYKDFGNINETTIMSIIFSSSLDKSIWFSTDKLKNNFLIDAKTTFIIPITVNMGNVGTCSFSIGTKFYVKSGPDGLPTLGNLSITSINMR